jgi:hypothetical protein
MDIQIIQQHPSSIAPPTQKKTQQCLTSIIHVEFNIHTMISAKDSQNSSSFQRSGDGSPPNFLYSGIL